MIKKYEQYLEDKKTKFVATKIVAAFPACGKTTFFNENEKLKLSDSDSTNFSWIVNDDGEKVRNPEFPNNYIEHIRECIGKYDYVFVSTHEEVRKALIDNSIFFYLISPVKTMKEEFMKRYEDRGNDDAFIKLLDKNWDAWLDEIHDSEEIGFKRYNITTKTPFLADVIEKYDI